MANIDMTRSASVFGAPRTTLLASLISALRDWNDARVTRKMLSTLTDRELDDIGLTRADIERV